MSTYPTWLAGMRVTAARLTGMQMQRVSQASDDTVNNSTTLIDTNIVIPLSADGIYWYWLRGWVRAAAAADIKLDWTLPSGASMDRNLWGPGPAATGGTDEWTTSSMRTTNAGVPIAFGVQSTSTTSPVWEHGTITCGSTAGNATLQFAQQTANASDCIFRAQSDLMYVRVG